MKHFLFFTLFSVSLFQLTAQNKSVGISHYVFSKFLKGEIIMKNGQQKEAWLNYNSLAEKMIFQDNGKKMAIREDQLNSIDTIKISNRKFIRLDNIFLEIVHHGNYNLYAEHKCRLEAPGTTNGYGGTSQVGSSSAFSSLESGGFQYELSLPKGYKANPYTYYCLKKNGEMNTIKNINQLTKLYNKKKAQLKSFKKSHKIDFNSPNDIAALISYLEAN